MNACLRGVAGAGDSRVAARWLLAAHGTAARRGAAEDPSGQAEIHARCMRRIRPGSVHGTQPPDGREAGVIRGRFAGVLPAWAGVCCAASGPITNRRNSESSACYSAALVGVRWHGAVASIYVHYEYSTELVSNSVGACTRTVSTPYKVLESGCHIIMYSCTCYVCVDNPSTRPTATLDYEHVDGRCDDDVQVRRGGSVR